MKSFRESFAKLEKSVTSKLHGLLNESFKRTALITLEEFLSHVKDLDCSTEKQSTVIKSLLDCSTHYCSRAVFFIVKNEKIFAWGSAGLELNDEELALLTFSVEDHPWNKVKEANGTVKLDKKDMESVFYKLQLPGGYKGVVLPFVLQSKIAGFLYADAIPGAELNVPALQILVYLSSLLIELRPYKTLERSPTLYQEGELEEVALELWKEQETKEVKDFERRTKQTEEHLSYSKESNQETGIIEDLSLREKKTESSTTVVEDIDSKEIEEGYISSLTSDYRSEIYDQEVGETVEREEKFSETEQEYLETSEKEEEYLDQQNEESAFTTFDEEEESTILKASSKSIEVEDDIEAAVEGIKELKGESEEESIEVEEEEDQLPEEDYESRTSDNFVETADFSGAVDATVRIDPSLIKQVYDSKQHEKPKKETVSPTPPVEPVEPASIEITPEVIVPDIGEEPGLAFKKGVSIDEISADERALHEEAKRLARLLVTDIKLYNLDKLREASANKNIYKVLEEDITKAFEVYKNRVAPEVLSSGKDYFTEALVDILAGGDPTVLGKDDG